MIKHQSCDQFGTITDAMTVAHKYCTCTLQILVYKAFTSHTYSV